MTGTPGRPLSAELSEQLLAVAVDILAEEGWSRLNSDRVAARARAGKAGIYRRWPTMAALARAAVGRFRLVELPEDTGSVRGDLRALADRWTVPLDREEKAAASIVGAARYDEQLRAGLDEALVRPLTEAVATIGERAQARGETIEDDRLALLYSVVEAFWWQRFTVAGDGAVLAEQVDRVVDEVLCPLVEQSEDLPVAV
ncbi:TetR/AcrR family transcriptional regulator C-terminal ligand-binding domain-containing protein [Blastococcus sp. TML/M2B]|uniref:TetR-like C-terminal domain-containing protein n=1 Tax=unclassified Blastococcus TaxID=2619396 RepID=UPI00190CFF01|nr:MULTISPECIES: TetR-like C-terminal domain-containing protein [unclassified Blastococcus]MBN1091221.1 TetR/AcrR family transcriptional regulator C-terminal ligand-binding domain-containing protein [Blastococcus sp. TML/M2B]MBN1095224.1 TetR/AcrR family transcriptional regulator C-terminal ligand-binding domain-containing protein [Blastococcus sp. TML/C7B]